jgi:hypothetical protein
MDVLAQLIALKAEHLTPLSTREIEREILVVRDLGEDAYKAYEARLRHTIQSLLAASIIRDAKMFAKHPPPAYNEDVDGSAWSRWVCARQDIMNQARTLLPAPQVAELEIRNGPSAIDIPPTTPKQLKSAKPA